VPAASTETNSPQQWPTNHFLHLPFLLLTHTLFGAFVLFPLYKSSFAYLIPMRPHKTQQKKAKKVKSQPHNTIQKNHSIAILKKHQHVNVIFSYTILGQHRQEAGTKVP
jgi:hypothetical protein